MKHAHLVNKRLALLLFVGISLGCERNTTQPLHPTPPVVATAGDAEIAQLVERASRKGTQAEYDAITVAYKALSVDQLELFNQLKLASDKKRLEQKLAQSGARVNQQQSAMIAQVLQQISEFRSAINQQSVKRYGVPYNQLASSQVNTLLDDQTQNYSLVMPNLEAPTDASARLSQPMDCSSASFLLIARKVSNGTQGWSGWTQRRTPNTSDCDYEFRYSGYRINFDPKDWFADRLSDSFNNAILRRYSSGYTRLLFGNRGVWLWIGYPGLLSVDMANY